MDIFVSKLISMATDDAILDRYLIYKTDEVRKILIMRLLPSVQPLLKRSQDDISVRVQALGK